MTEQNLEVARRLLSNFRDRDTQAEAGFSDSDLAANVALLDPDVELDATRVPMDDIRGTYRGVEENAGFWARWLEAWEGFDFDTTFTAVGDDVLVAVPRQRMRGRGSGVDVDFPPYWILMTVRGGRLVRYVFFTDEREARAAAGRSAPS